MELIFKKKKKKHDGTSPAGQVVAEPNWTLDP